MHAQVVVLGSYMQDLVFNCRQFPAAGETVVGDLALGPGGKGSNQAVAAVRAGATTTFIGAVGADAFGIAAREFHVKEGIDCRMLAKPDCATGTAAILVNSSGQNEIIVALGANDALSVEDLENVITPDTKVFVTQLEANLAATARALELARAASVPTILNPAPMRTNLGRSFLANVDVLIPNETEFCALLNQEVTEETLRVTKAGDLHALCRRLPVPTVILTLGARGCFVSLRDGDHWHVPAVSGIQPVDTTGAGDAFVGAFAASMARTNNVAASVLFANRAAAISVTRRGAALAMATRKEIETALAVAEQ